MMRPVDAWGPFAAGLPEVERVARCRALAAFVRVYTGPEGEAAVTALRGLETNANTAPAALEALDRLPARSRRGALASFAALHWPAARNQR